MVFKAVACSAGEFNLIVVYISHENDFVEVSLLTIIILCPDKMMVSGYQKKLRWGDYERKKKTMKLVFITLFIENEIFLYVKIKILV